MLASGIALIVRRSLKQHALSTLVTVVSVALATGLVMAVFCVRQQAHEAFTGGPIGFDAVLGARGSQLQLVLNTVFHLETSPGNISYKLFKAVQKNPKVELAVPYAVGDNLRGFRIVGTSLDLFTKFEYQEGKKFTLAASTTYAPRFFNEDKMEAVVGSYAAQKLGLKVNDTFNPYHGLNFDESMKHEEEYRVTGILEPTNSPSDRVIWIPLEGMYRMKGHVLRDSTGNESEAKPGEAIDDEHKEVSAVMLKLKNPQAGFLLSQEVNRQGKIATLAWPIATVMSELFDKIGWIDKILELVAYLVVLVSAGSILASIYNTMNERRREFAIMRALGARRATVFSAIVAEAASISALGSVCGYLVYALILGGAAYVIRKETGVVLNVFEFQHVLWAAPLGMTLLGALSGIVPALKAYGTDVASNLMPAT